MGESPLLLTCFTFLRAFIFMGEGQNLREEKCLNLLDSTVRCFFLTANI